MATGAWVELLLTPESAERVQLDPQVTADGTPAERLHVTLGYMNKPAAVITPATRRAVLARLRDQLHERGHDKPVSARIAGWGYLNPEGGNAMVLLLEGCELDWMHDAVTRALGFHLDTKFPGWLPHVTLKEGAFAGDEWEERHTGFVELHPKAILCWGDERVII